MRLLLREKLVQLLATEHLAIANRCHQHHQFTEQKLLLEINREKLYIALRILLSTK